MPIDWQRAERNYEALLRGQKQIYDLTYPERIELIEFRRHLAERIDGRTPRERCLDEQRERLGKPKPSYLDRRHINMVCRGEKDE